MAGPTRLYAAAAALGDADRRVDKGAFFKSVHGTLNHLVATDRIWMRRFTGEGPTYDRLDAIPYDDFAELCAAREAEDQRIATYVEGLDEPALAGAFDADPFARRTAWPASQSNKRSSRAISARIIIPSRNR